MKEFVQNLFNNRDTLIEGIIYSIKEHFQEKKDFFDDKDNALDCIGLVYEDVEIFYERTWKSLKDVRRDFSTDSLKRLRRDLYKVVVSALRMIAILDKALESKGYWEFYNEGENE